MSDEQEYHNNVNFDEYMEDAERLMRLMFGDEVVDQLKSTKLKAIDWDGLDVKHYSMLATTHDIKTALKPINVEYANDNGADALNYFLGFVFRYGYQQCCDNDLKESRFTIRTLRETVQILKERMQRNLDKSE